MSVIEQGDFERCCRLCAEQQDVTVMIFSEEAEVMLLQHKLNNYLLIEVDEDDKLPKNICITCCSKLQTVCEFIDTARKAQEVLLNRSLILDQISSEKCMNASINCHIKTEPIVNHNLHDEESKFTEMEICVDPMMVLQNSEDISPIQEVDCILEDVTYLHGFDGENVTIKLIKKGDNQVDSKDEQDNCTKPFLCITCKQSYNSELELKNHSWIHVTQKLDNKLFRCTTCMEGFGFKSDLIHHLKQHKNKGVCQLCGRKFRSDRTYIMHMAAHLSPKKSYTCKICGRSYSTWGNLKTHSISHSTERPYHCSFCKKTFKRNQDLKFHTNQHTGAKPYKCPFCDKCFASSGNCYSHRSRMHPGRRVEGKVRRWNVVPRDNQMPTPRPIAPKPTLTSVKGIFKYQCQLCEHSFVMRDNYTYHMYQHTGEKPFRCSFCSEKFVTRRGLLLHHDKDHAAIDRPLALLTKNVLLK